MMFEAFSESPLPCSSPLTNGIAVILTVCEEDVSFKVLQAAIVSVFS